MSEQMTNRERTAWVDKLQKRFQRRVLNVGAKVHPSFVGVNFHTDGEINSNGFNDGVCVLGLSFIGVRQTKNPANNFYQSAAENYGITKQQAILLEKGFMNFSRSDYVNHPDFDFYLIGNALLKRMQKKGDIDPNYV